MATHFKTRWPLFGFASLIEGTFATVILRFRWDQISQFGFYRVFLANLVLILISYLIFYMVNGLFIRLFDSSELNRLQKSILRRLVEAAIRGAVIETKAGDLTLTEEAAWIATKKYWRSE